MKGHRFRLLKTDIQVEMKGFFKFIDVLIRESEKEP